MFETLVAQVLNKVLGDYVSNLETSQLSIAIWQGDVVLHNLKLKTSALDKFNLPVDVLEGYLGDLTLNIPWNDLKNKPVKIRINNVYLLAAPKLDQDYDPEEEVERALKRKFEKLEAAEMIVKGAKESIPSRDRQNSSFMTQLATKVIDNLQFSISNIHIRYEDRISSPQCPFSVGFTLEELTAVSTDEFWNEKFISEETGVIYKSLRLGSLAVYWNTEPSSLGGKSMTESVNSFMALIASATKTTNLQYVLKPVSGRGKLTLRKSYKEGSPTTSADLDFDDLGFELDDEQYKTGIYLLHAFEMYVRSSKYRKFRPPRTITPAIDPRAWFKYAGTCILSDIKERNRKKTWAFLKDRRDDRLAYVKLYKKFKAGTPAMLAEESISIKAYERKLSYEDIRFYRSIASSQLKKEKAAVLKAASVTAATSASTSPSKSTASLSSAGGGGAGDTSPSKSSSALTVSSSNEVTAAAAASWSSWGTGWLWSAQPTDAQKKSNDASSSASSSSSNLFSEEQIKQLYDTIEFDPEATFNNEDLPREAMQLKIRFTLKRGSLTIRKNPRSKSPINLIYLSYTGFAADVIQYPFGSYKADVSLKGMLCTDGSTPGTLYPNLIKAKEKKEGMEDRTSQSGIISTAKPSFSDHNINFFNMRVEIKPLDDRADSAVEVKMLPLEVVYNPDAIKALISFFNNPYSNYDSVTFGGGELSAIKAAKDTIQDITSQTRLSLEHAIQEHSTLALKIDVDAPIFIFPENCTNKKSLVVVLDTGHFQVESNLADKSIFKELQLKRSTDMSKQYQEKISSLLYDHFSISMTSVQILVGDSLEDCLNEIGSGSIENKSPRPTIKSGNLHFIDRVNMAFELEMCIMPKDLMFTLMRVSGNLPRLHLNFSDRKYRAVMNAVGMITSSLSGLGGGGDATTAVIGSADGSPLSTTSGGGVGAATAAANAAGAASYQDGHQWPELLVPSAAIDPQHDDLTVDTDGSEFFDAPEAITEDGFSDTAEYPTMNTSTGVTAAKSFDKNTAASSAMSQAKLILLKSSKIIVEFYFHVSEASASLKKYNSSSRTATSGLSLDIPSTFTPSPAIIADLVTGSETDLADICVYDFDLKYILRQYDTTYNIQIGNAIIEDKMQSSDSPFKYLLSKKSTSCEDSAGSSDSVKNGDDQLIKIMYKNMNKPSPDYIGVDQAVEVGFGSTDLIITRNSILTLYDYVLTTFSYASAPASSASNQDLPVAATTPLPITAPTTPAVASNILANLPPIATAADGGHSSSFTAPPNSAHLATSSSTSFIAVSSTHPKSNTMTVELSMKSTKIIFNKDGCHIATSVFDDGLISITMKTKTMLVTGKLRDIKIFDELPRSKESKFPDRYRQFVSIQGGEAANFVYETFNKLDYENYPGYDSALTFIASSLRMTYVEEFYVQFMNYLNEFQKMHFLLEAARKAAYDSAAQIQETAGGRFHFNVQMQTPILVFPDPSLLSEKSMTMYLGKLTAMNNFTELDPVKYGAERPVLIDEISATLQSMKLTSSDGFSTPDREMADIEVLEDVHIDYYWQRFNINLDRISKNEAIKPDSEMVVKVSDLRTRVTKSQYTLFFEILYSAMRGLGFYGPPAQQTVSSAVLTTEAERLPHASPVATAVSAVAAQTPFSATSAYSEASVHSSLDELAAATSYTSLSVNAKVTTDILVEIPTVSLEILTQRVIPEQAGSIGSESSLAKFIASRFVYKTCSYEDGASDSEYQLNSLRIVDTRMECENVYRDILSPVHGSDNNILSCLVNRESLNGPTSYFVTIDSPKFILVLDHYFAVNEFFFGKVAAKSADQSPESTKAASAALPVGLNDDDRGDGLLPSPESAMVEEEVRAQDWNYRVNVVDLEVIVLQNPTNVSTEAIILTSKQLVVAYDVITSFSSHNLGMFFCSMDQRTETTLRFIQNFDLALTWESQETSPGHLLTNVMIDVTPLMLRMSYRDVLLILDIMKQFTDLSAAAGKDKDKPVNGNQAGSPSNTATIKPGIAMARERLQLSTQGLRAILIDDLNDLHLPMFDLVLERISLEASDWSSLMRVDTGLVLHLNYFNIKNSHWEPVIEPWQALLNVTRATDGATAVDFFSRKKLELNITHNLIETLLNTSDRWSKQDTRKLLTRRGVHAPYILRNRTGYDMHVWAESIGDGLDTELQMLKNNGEIPWRFDDWRVMRESTSMPPNKLSLQIMGPAWESMKAISVDRQGTKNYVLRPSVNGVSHRLVCEVRLKDNVKVVTFRSSTLVENGTKVGVELKMINGLGQQTGNLVHLAPGDEFAVPIESSYSDRILIRPQGFGYGWSKEMLKWQELQKKRIFPLVSCPSDVAAAPFVFQINSIFPPEARGGDYPNINIKIIPPFQLENLLPYDMQYVIIDKSDNSTRQEHTGLLAKGALDTIHTIFPTHLLALIIRLPQTEFKESELAVITNTDMDYRDETISLNDSQDRTLVLRIKYSDILENGGRKVSIYSPYVLLNKTGLDMLYSARSIVATTRLAAGQASDRHAKRNQIDPFMFSYTNFEPLRSRAQIKVSDSDWSKPLSFEAVGGSYDVILSSPSKGLDIHLGVSITEGQGKFFLTKVITFMPRFILTNMMDQELICRQYGGAATVVVAGNTSSPLHYLGPGAQQQLCFRLGGLLNDWSQPFVMNQIGTFYVKVGKMGSELEELMKVEAMLEAATVFLVFTKAEGRWPFRIDNNADEEVVVWQKNCKNHYLVQRHSIRNYAWDNPSSQEKILVIHINGREREIDVAEIGQVFQIKYPIDTKGNTLRVIGIQVVAEGPVLVIKLFNLAETVRRSSAQDTHRLSISTAAGSEGRSSGEKIDEKEMLTVRFRLEGIGISLIDAKMQELLYASAKNVTVNYIDATTVQQFNFSIKWMQIDNQLYGGLEPIFMYPTNIPRDGEEEFKPVLFCTYTKSKDTSYGVDYYHFASVLLQELSFEMDEDFLFTLIKFFKFDVAGWEEKEGVLFDVSPSVNAVPTPQSYDGDMRLYFERFLLQPVKINVSFARTKVMGEEARPRSQNILTFFFDVFTMAIGNIHDAPIRMNALELQHPIINFSQLINLIIKFYSQELVGQIHKVIGSADVLGNPVGLFNSVSSGVSDLFYEPLQGFEITRPQDFGIGLAKGGASLVKKTVYGFSDTLSKFTGSVGKGLSVLTMDEEFQEKRRIRSSRNRPRHAVYGVTQGVVSLAQSVGSGLGGLVSKPLQGAEKGGVGGFFKGLGKGAVGVVTKSVVGVFDLASNVSEGIKNTTTVFETDLDRQRLPRFISSDGILKPFDPREALGLSWLKGAENGGYFHDEYIAHLEINIEDLVAIVTNKRVVMVRIKKLRVEYQIPYEDLQLVRMETGGITLIQKGVKQARARVIPCPDNSTSQWLSTKIENAFTDFLTLHRPYD